MIQGVGEAKMACSRLNDAGCCSRCCCGQDDMLMNDTRCCSCCYREDGMLMHNTGCSCCCDQDGMLINDTGCCSSCCCGQDGTLMNDTKEMFLLLLLFRRWLGHE